MPDCRDVITRALRKLAYIGQSETPSTADEDTAMAALQSMFDAWAAGGAFGPIRDVYKDAPYTAKAGDRVRTTQAVTLPPYTADTAGGGCDDYGVRGACDGDRPSNRRLIIVVNPTTGERQTNLWDAWRGQWTRIEALKPADECPLAALGADGLACCLAVAISDEAGQPVGTMTQVGARGFMRRLTSQNDGRRTATRPEFC